jgi:medium-chain acyl-[acyl-carrier-protein] hydrolase
MNTRERFQSAFTIASYETDLQGNLSLFALFNRFQELAGLHAAFLQVGYDALRTMNLAWILSRISLQIESMPVWGDTVELSTWPKGIDRMFAMRDFQLADSSGKTLVSATSAWLLFDFEKSRPRRIEALTADLRFPSAPHALWETPDKIQMPENSEPIGERHVWLSDIDTNQHVNNAQYAKWASDCFAEEEFRKRRMAFIQINYLEGTTLGDTISLWRAAGDLIAGEYFATGMSRARGSAVFQTRCIWK